MVAVIVVFAVTIALMLACTVVKPRFVIKKFTVSTYWVVTLIGAAAVIIFGLADVKEIAAGLTQSSAVNPIKILALFLSMTVLSVFLDEIGFFRYFANVALLKAKSGGKRMFVYLYLIVSVLTIFTSNDIIVLTFTPFICYFAKNSGLDPLPFLITEFVAANTCSMVLIIGNPTNIFLATAAGIDFFSYLKIMLLPSLLGGATAFAVLYLIFRKKLSIPLQPARVNTKIENKPLLAIGLFHLSACSLLLVISSYVNIEMWLVAVVFAASLFICSGIYYLITKSRPCELINCLKRTPWELVPFVLSMFVFVLSLDNYGVTVKIARLLGEDNVIFKYGIASALFANIINNIPMSVLFSAVTAALPQSAALPAVYASVIGSNIGAYLTPIGALAGIMWIDILKKFGINLSFVKFLSYGAAVALPTLLASLLGLFIVFL